MMPAEASTIKFEQYSLPLLIILTQKNWHQLPFPLVNRQVKFCNGISKSLPMWLAILHDRL